MTVKVESEAVSEGEVCIIVIDSGCVHMERVVGSDSTGSNSPKTEGKKNVERLT